ncbi:MAG TPA: hypothetical protein ENI15_03500 [Spirochaetes bacterium]|nr:hypothetical protein [Spirochaetota bacterium]
MDNKRKNYYLWFFTVFFICSIVLSLTGARKMRTVKLFVKDQDTGDLVIHRSYIPRSSSTNEDVFWIIKELISGPFSTQYESMFDPEIEVKEIIIKGSVAYISFDWSMIESLYENPSLAVRSIVDSILLNIRKLEEVKILIEGIEPVSTFSEISLQKTFK